MHKSDVIVIGSGPAGLHAAISLKQRFGLTPLIVEREPEAGGVPRWCDHHTFPCRVKRRLFRGPEYARVWVKEARSAGIEIRTETSVLRIASDRPSVDITSPSGPAALESRAILLATGAREAHRHQRLVAGDRARGVFTTASLFQYMYANNRVPGNRFVIFGSEDVSYSCVRALRSHGAEVVSVVEPAPATRSWPAVRWYFERLLRVPHYFSVEEFEIHAHDSVESVTFRVSGNLLKMDCNAVVFTGGFTPNAELVRASAVEFSPSTRGPSINQCFQTSLPWVFAAGNCLRGVVSGDEAGLEGRHAAGQIARYLSGALDAGAQVRIETLPPLAYACPDRIALGSRGTARIGIWPREHISRAELVVKQNDRVLWRNQVRSVQPGRRLFLPLDRLRIDSTDTIQIELE